MREGRAGRKAEGRGEAEVRWRYGRVQGRGKLEVRHGSQPGEAAWLSQCVREPSTPVAWPAMASKRGVSLAPRRVARVVVPDDHDDDAPAVRSSPWQFGSQPASAGTATTRSRAKPVVSR